MSENKKEEAQEESKKEKGDSEKEKIEPKPKPRPSFISMFYQIKNTALDNPKKDKEGE